MCRPDDEMDRYNVEIIAEDVVYLVEGEIVRHRAFYIYDRSIPVGFETGKDHNVENGILVRRYIE